MKKCRPNDLCWCGSGIKFKKCHRERESESRLHPVQLRHSTQQLFSKKVCLHPEASPDFCNKIINAHTVQRANTLQALIDSKNHVRSFYPFEPNSQGHPKVQRLGWQHASTFTGFCGHHDSKTFAPVEQGSFSFTPETAFLLTYRALCHELFQKQGAERASLHAKSLIDRGESPERQRQIQHMFSCRIAGIQKAVRGLERIKQLADKELLAKDYTNWQFVCLTFCGPQCFATSGAVTPNQDLSRSPLQSLHDQESMLQHLYISVVAGDGAPQVVLGWRKEHSAPKLFVESLLAVSRDLFLAYFVQYIFAHLENVYFSDEWWCSLTKQDQEHIQELAGNSDAYYFPPEYIATPTVPWSLVSEEYYGLNIL